MGCNFMGSPETIEKWYCNKTVVQILTFTDIYQSCFSGADVILNYIDQIDQTKTPQIAKFMGPTWGPSGADRTQVGPMLAPWTLLSGTEHNNTRTVYTFLVLYNPRFSILKPLLRSQRKKHLQMLKSSVDRCCMTYCVIGGFVATHVI